MNKLYKLIYGAYIKKKYSSHNRDYSIWLFGEWFGKKCCDNCMYFANYVSENYPEIKVYWACYGDTDTSVLNDNIVKIIIGTNDALNIYKTAGVVIVGQRLADFSEGGWNYFDGAITLHLWHGVPWKKIGHDAVKKHSLIIEMYSKIYDELFGFKYYVSPSDKYDTIAQSAFGAKKENIIHAGYARNSIFYDNKKIAYEKNTVINKLRSLSSDVDFSNSRIVTYMPTFRDSKEYSYSIMNLKNNPEFIKYINDENVIIIQKAHFVNQSRDGFCETKGSNRFYTLNDISAQTLLCATDLLITDYSSAFFDYIILNRPVIHYLYDYEYYCKDDRGLYYPKEAVMAGEEADDEDALVKAIIKNLNNPGLYEKTRKKIKNLYVKYDTEESCDVLYNAIQKLCKEAGNS